MDVMEGIEAADPTPLFTEDEKRVLEVYDRLEDLQLEIALLKAQGVLGQDNGLTVPDQVSEHDIHVAQQELLEAKANYQVRSTVIENVLIANPILNAVHAGKNASVVERDLLPVLERRDELSITLCKASQNLMTTRDELTTIVDQNRAMNQENAKLATKMLSIVEEANIRNEHKITDPNLRQKLTDLESEMNISRKRWRIMKGTASATIVGSGIDWARDPALLEIVLDKDE